jgi:hypothetical protein
MASLLSFGEIECSHAKPLLGCFAWSLFAAVYSSTKAAAALASDSLSTGVG